MVSNQERRAAVVVPQINRRYAADKPRVNRTFCSPIGLCGFSFVRACAGSLGTVVHDARCPGGRKGRLSPKLAKGRLSPSHPAAPPRPDPPVICPGFGFDKLKARKEGRAAVVQALDHASTGRPALVNCSPRSLIPLYALHEKDLQQQKALPRTRKELRPRSW